MGPSHGGLRPLRLDDRAAVRDGRPPPRLPRDLAGAAHRPLPEARARSQRRRRPAQPVLTRRAPCPAGFGSSGDRGPRPGRLSRSSGGRRHCGGPKASRRRSHARRARSAVGSRSSGSAEASRTSLRLRPISASSRRSIFDSVLRVARAAATRNGQAAARLAPAPTVPHMRFAEIMGSHPF